MRHQSKTKLMPKSVTAENSQVCCAGCAREQFLSARAQLGWREHNENTNSTGVDAKSQCKKLLDTKTAFLPSFFNREKLNLKTVLSLLLT